MGEAGHAIRRLPGRVACGIAVLPQLGNKAGLACANGRRQQANGSNGRRF